MSSIANGHQEGYPRPLRAETATLQSAAATGSAPNLKAVSVPVEHLTPDVVPSAGPPHASVGSGSTMYFFSGQVGRRADGTPAGDTMRAQFAQLIRNLVAVATAVGVGPQHLAKTTVYVKDWRPELIDEYLRRRRRCCRRRR